MHWMSLDTGTKPGAYEILGSIGAGGMAEVYRAADTRLHREVAIKISTERFSERFEREARAIASLNHPSVCTLHDVTVVLNWPAVEPSINSVAINGVDPV